MIQSRRGRAVVVQVGIGNSTVRRTGIANWNDVAVVGAVALGSFFRVFLVREAVVAGAARAARTNRENFMVVVVELWIIRSARVSICYVSFYIHSGIILIYLHYYCIMYSVLFIVYYRLYVIHHIRHCYP